MTTDFSSAQPRPNGAVPSTTEWLRRKGLGRNGRPLIPPGEQGRKREIAA